MSAAIDTAAAVVFVVCRGPGDRHHLRTLRKWIATDAHARDMIRDVVYLPTLDDLAAAAAPPGGGALAVLAGFSDAQAAEAHRASPWLARILVTAATGGPGGASGDAGPIALVTDVTAAVGEYLVRARNQGYTVREIVTPEELRDYFSLRYEVWSSAGYIPRSRDAARARLELDYTDRTSVPIGAYTPEGRLAGCARLVHQLGAERPDTVRTIKDIIKQAGDPILRQNFAYPRVLSHPFDILDAFPGFRDYYQRLVRERRSKAEVSRVIVHPEHRGHRLGQRLVDHLVDIAVREGVNVIFLACRPEIRHLYEASGFQIVPDLSAPRFEDIPIASIVMERVL
jgi:ribosomal protein S18 acetylase RimI-like enzyme